MKMIKMETDIIMESHKSIQSTSSTSFAENTLENANVHDHIVENNSENVLCDDDLIANEFENVLHDNDEDLISNEFKNVLCNNEEDLISNILHENLLSEENLSSENEFSDENSRVIQDNINTVTENNVDRALNRNIDFKTFLSQWAIKERISQSSLSSLLKGIKQYTCNNCSFNIPLDSRTLLRTPKSSNVEICAGGQYYHFGLREGILSILPSVSQDITDIKISINVDGLPLSKSSQRQFWPILGSIFESKEVFIIGIYYGIHKPSDSNEFLAKFVDEAKILHEEGITINNRNIPCTIHSIICDAPAKAFVLQTKGHNGYSSCTKCIIEGSYINNKMCFPDTNVQLRTDKDFRLRKDENFHIGQSAILKLPDFDIVNNIPLDYTCI